MTKPRIYCPINVDAFSPVSIPSLELLNQLKNVLRLKPKDRVLLFDSTGYDYEAEILDFTKDSVSFSIGEKRENKVRPSRETYLFASLVKKDNFEWIVQKATEMGVSHIIPVLSARSEKKNLNIERLTRIIIEAAEQSGRATIPKLSEILDLEKALATYSYLSIIAWEPAAEKFSQQEVDQANAMIIGPEGGWTDEELELFREHKVSIRSLGPQILRAETAVVAVLSRFVF